MRQLVVAIVIASAAPTWPLPPSIAQNDLRRAIAAQRIAQAPAMGGPVAADVALLYRRSDDAPAWVNGEGRPTDALRAGLVLLEEAASDGLDPAAYDVAALSALSAALNQSASPAPAAAAQLDVRMSAAVLRYYRHIHLGRVDPHTLGWQLSIPAEEHDFAEMLRTAIDRNRLAETAATLRPPLAQYDALKAMLARYRSLAVAVDGPLTVARTLRPGDASTEVPAVRRLLEAVGDLPPGAAAPASDVYDKVMSEGVARFQGRHGLEADAIIGRATQAALQVPLAWRARQIELALERLRWLPDLSQGRLVVVNIPMFRLVAWDSLSSDSRPALSMAVIVGRALDTRTPVFAEDLRYVVFRPYWNVPRSILRGEILPALRKDPEYLASQNFEIVGGPEDAAPVLAPTAENIAALGTGDLRLRQRPGPKNALGEVKFMLPNRNDVYLHATPAPQLFRSSRRDFSHGCIRVEDPVRLAEWVLGRDPSWTRERILGAMNGPDNARVDLAESIHVVIFYTTAVVQQGNGTIHFADDLYGHDSRLARAIGGRK